MELLDAIEGRPLINIQSSNPSLYTHIHDIGAIEVTTNIGLSLSICKSSHPSIYLSFPDISLNIPIVITS